ncbi:NAD(P)H-binding protein [Actinomadura vinacea]|uniref:NAD(P)H-binding protein n=1 Tax=Actinomadura vinacea TaxID=115336 RepID=A0ABP5WT42_9ACTN
MTEKPILILGGTGKTGRRVASLLRAQGTPVRAASRSGEHPFDWTDRATWAPALEGVRAVFVVPLDGETLTGPLVERAVRLGAERVVLLSGRGVDVPGYGAEDSPLAATHIEGERAVRDLDGTTWTIVRPGWFAQNFSEGFFQDAVRAGEIRIPAGDGAASFVDAEDIAAVAAAALTEDGHAGRIYELSGPRALTMAEATAEISEATGRPVRYVPLTPEEFVAELVKEGWAEPDAQDFADAVAPIRNGLDAHISDGVRQALGREPRGFAAFAKAAAAAGAWDG